MELLSVNAGKTRRETLNGREYLVAPLTMIVPGVLNGSKGALFYPESEVARNPGLWNMTPLVVGHPVHNGQNVSGRDPRVFAERGLGWVFNDDFRDGKRVGEGWFDVQMTRDYDRRNGTDIYGRTERGLTTELSTGLFTDDLPATNGSVCPKTGRMYTLIARNYRPDHLAILPDQTGACSVKDGCGVNVNIDSTQRGVNVNAECLDCGRLVGNEEIDLVQQSLDQSVGVNSRMCWGRPCDKLETGKSAGGQSDARKHGAEAAALLHEGNDEGALRLLRKATDSHDAAISSGKVKGGSKESEAAKHLYEAVRAIKSGDRPRAKELLRTAGEHYALIRNETTDSADRELGVNAKMCWGRLCGGGGLSHAEHIQKANEHTEDARKHTRMAEEAISKGETTLAKHYLDRADVSHAKARTFLKSASDLSSAKEEKNKKGIRGTVLRALGLNAKYDFDAEDCPKCGVAMEGDPDSGKCNSCGHKWGKERTETTDNALPGQPHSANTGQYKPLGSGTGKGEHHAAAQSGAMVLTDEDRADGAAALAEVATTGENPASWVADEGKWDKAKTAAKEGGYAGDSYWAVVAHIYKNMGGKKKLAAAINDNSEPPTEGDDMATRAENIQYLTTNCDCWKGKEKLLGNSDPATGFSDADVQKLRTNAETGAANALVVNAVRETMRPPAALTVNAIPDFIKKKMEDAKDKGVDDDEEDAAGDKKATKNVSNDKGKVMTDREWLESAPPTVRSAVQNAMEIEREAKSRIVSRLVANVGEPDAKTRLATKLMTNSLPDLRDMAAMLPVTNDARQSQASPLAPLYFGDPAPTRTDNVDRDDVLDIPVLNYTEEAATRRKAV